MKRRTAWIVGLLIAALMIVGAPSLASATSNPYTPTPQGIQLNEGVFKDNGHVNINTSAPHTDLHFEAKCIDRTDAECAGARHDAAQYIGKTFIPWSAFGLKAGDCVSWIQLAEFNYHYGAQEGDTPVCVGSPTTPSPTSEPSSTPTSTPEVTATPTTTPVPTSTPISCPPGTVPGMLDENGNPQGCSNNQPGNTPEPTSTPTSPTNTAIPTKPGATVPTPTILPSEQGTPPTVYADGTAQRTLPETGANLVGLGLLAALGAGLLITGAVLRKRSIATK